MNDLVKANIIKRFREKFCVGETDTFAGNLVVPVIEKFLLSMCEESEKRGADNKVSTQVRYQRRMKAEGKCQKCGHELSIKNRSYCDKHRIDSLRYSKESYLKRKNK